jgi:hypothetical protein
VFLEYLKDNFVGVDYKEFVGFSSAGEGGLAVWLFKDTSLNVEVSQECGRDRKEFLNADRGLVRISYVRNHGWRFF